MFRYGPRRHRRNDLVPQTMLRSASLYLERLRVLQVRRLGLGHHGEHAAGQTHAQLAGGKKSLMLPGITGPGAQKFEEMSGALLVFICGF